MLSRFEVIIFSLAFLGYFETCHSICDTRSIRNYTTGQLEICERNTSNPNVNSWFHVCIEPTPDLIASILCRETPCGRFCNRFNYTISHLPTNITAYEYDCEIDDTRTNQCPGMIVSCDSIINTLNCDCDTDRCPNDYTSTGFCSTNECSCRTGLSGPDCVEIPDTEPSTAANSLPSTISTTNSIPVTFTMTTNQSGINATALANSQSSYSVWIGVTVCFLTVILICAALFICVVLLVIYIRTRSTKLKGLERRIIFTNQNGSSPATNDLVMRPHPCNEDDDSTYASINYNGMSENCNNPNDLPTVSDSRYSSAEEARRSTIAAQYLSPSFIMADTQQGFPHPNSMDESTDTREMSQTQVVNVDNPLYFTARVNETTFTRYKRDLYATYEAIGSRPHIFSSSVVLSHQQRVSSAPLPVIDTVYFSKQEEFVEPPSDVNALYDCMSKQRFREINQKCLLLHQKIGSGSFGEVQLAEWRLDQDSEPLPVAVKLLSDNAEERMKASFLKEAAIMGQFRHPNVLQLLGIVSLTQPLMLVLELMESDLRNILESLAGVEFDSDRLAVCLLKSTREIACGMAYLSSRHYVHRDLAARNVLVGQDRSCRISDFGMSKRIHENMDYYKVEKGGVVPLRWTAPEAILFRRYSEKSDVWSLGMTLFEVWSVGSKPWSGYDNQEVIGMVSSNQMQGPPTGCPYAIYSLMVSSWHSDPDQRPTFRQVSEFLTRSDGELLRIPEEVRSNAMACQLGKDPSLTAELYPELRS